MLHEPYIIRKKYNNGDNKSTQVYFNLLFTPQTPTYFDQPCGHFQGCYIQRLGTLNCIKLNRKSIGTNA